MNGTEKELVALMGDEECVLCEQVAEGVSQVLHIGHVTECVKEYRKIMGTRDNEFYINTVKEFAEASSSQISVH